MHSSSGDRTARVCFWFWRQRLRVSLNRFGERSSRGVFFTSTLASKGPQCVSTRPDPPVPTPTSHNPIHPQSTDRGRQGGGFFDRDRASAGRPNAPLVSEQSDDSPPTASEQGPAAMDDEDYLDDMLAEQEMMDAELAAEAEAQAAMLAVAQVL